MQDIGNKRSVKIKAVERWENEGGSICKDDGKTNEVRRRRVGADSAHEDFEESKVKEPPVYLE